MQETCLLSKSIKLKYAISFLVILTAFCTTTVIWYTSFHALKQTLTDQYPLESNYLYAQKTALSTSDLLNNMQQYTKKTSSICPRKT